jgi:hypothetical protein
MAHAINTNTQSLADWYKNNQNVEYELRDPEPSAITLMTGGMNSDEMIRVTKDGFWVRGVKVPQDDREAETVYNAFKQWMAWAALTQRR